MSAQPSPYEFQVQPPVTAGDVAYVPLVQREIDGLKDKHTEVAQIYARSFGRSAGIDMLDEVDGGNPDTVRVVTASLAEAFAPGLGSFFKSGVEDALALTVENAGVLQGEQS